MEIACYINEESILLKWEIIINKKTSVEIKFRRTIEFLTKLGTEYSWLNKIRISSNEGSPEQRCNVHILTPQQTTSSP